MSVECDVGLAMVTGAAVCACACTWDENETPGGKRDKKDSIAFVMRSLLASVLDEK